MNNKKRNNSKVIFFCLGLFVSLVGMYAIDPNARPLFVVIYFFCIRTDRSRNLWNECRLRCSYY